LKINSKEEISVTKKVIGIDIGGTQVRVGLIDETLQIIRKEVASTASCRCKLDLFRMIKEMIDKIDPTAEVQKIGFALPVPWMPNLETITDATNIVFLENVKVSEIKEFFNGYEVCIENDVNVVAMLEAKVGSAKNYKHSLYMTVSTGIGSGIIINQEIFHGTHGFGGEIGNIQITDSKGCYSCGTLENLCSGLALEEKSKALFGEESTASLLFEKFQSGDIEALRAIDEWVEYFSSGMASVIHSFDPGIIVLGGSVIQHNQWLVEKVVEKTREKVFSSLVNQVRMVVSKFGSDVGMIGAGFLVINNKKEQVK
jgi:glucokinase